MHSKLTKQDSILIATSGTEPQVVIATLDLLRDRGENISQTLVVSSINMKICMNNKIYLLVREVESFPFRDFANSTNLSAPTKYPKIKAQLVTLKLNFFYLFHYGSEPIL
jgi:hypothetical protein